MEHRAPGATVLCRLVRASTARPALTIAIGLTLGVIGALSTLRALTFETSSVRLLPRHRLYVERYEALVREFGDLSDIVVAVEGPSVERAQAYVDRVAADIKALPAARRVSHRIDPDAFAGHALLYLSRHRLADLRANIVAHRRFIEAYAAHPTLAGILHGIDHEIARRFAVGFLDLGLDDDAPERFDAGFIDRLLAVLAHGLDGTAPPGSPWRHVFAADDAGGSGYFVSSDKKLLFVFVQPTLEAASFTDDQDFIAAIRRVLRAAQHDFPDVAAGVTGAPALANDEMLTTFRDSARATLLAAALTLAVVLVVCRRVVEPCAMVVVLAISLAWSLGIITATVGHLTVFSVMFISLLVGMGIDYGIYVFFRYDEELRGGRTPRRALTITALRTGPGIVFGALGGAGAFAVLMLTEFRGVQEFGFVAGVAIVTALLAMTTVFPAVLVVLGRRAVAPVHAASRPGGSDDVAWLARLWASPTAIVVVTAALTAYSLAALPAVRFDGNRLNLQARDSESALWERRIVASRRSGFAALTTADSLSELRTKQAAFERLPAVAEVTSILTLIPADQDAKIPLVRDIAAATATVRVRDVPHLDLAAVRRALGELQRRLELAMREADPGTTVDTLRSAHRRTEVLLAGLTGGEANAVHRLAPVQASLRDDFAALLRRLGEHLTPRPLTMRDVPDELARKFVGRSGRMLMMVYPAIDTWNDEGAREFVRQLRTVDDGVTGPPVIAYEASRLMEAAYFRGTLYAAVVVAALTIVTLRRVPDALLAMTPLALGTLWTIGAMRIFGLPFNLANVWALPLIVGAAAEYGLNVSLRFRESSERGRPGLPASTVRAVLLNGLTNMSGFGSLMVARHQGMFGLGLVLTIGAMASLASSLVVLPTLLGLLHRKSRHSPAPGAGDRLTPARRGE